MLACMCACILVYVACMQCMHVMHVYMSSGIHFKTEHAIEEMCADSRDFWIKKLRSILSRNVFWTNPACRWCCNRPK